MRWNERKIAAVTAAPLCFVLGVMTLVQAKGDAAAMYLQNGIGVLLILFAPLLLLMTVFGLPRCVKRPSARSLVSAALTGTALLLPLTMAGQLGAQIWSLLGVAAPYAGQLPPLQDARSVLCAVFYVSAAAPLGEEMLFRGLVQQTLLRRYPKAGLLLASALFGAAHLSLYAFLPTFLLGLMLGTVCRRHSLFAAMALHGAYNAAALLAQGVPQTFVPVFIVSLMGLFLLGRVTVTKD